MNNDRRARIDELIDRLTTLSDEIEELKDEEQSAFDNMPDSIQQSEKGEHMEGSIECLDESIEYIAQCVNSLQGATE